MWTGVNAVQTEGAIHIAHLLRLKESKFTSSLDHYQVRRLAPSPPNAIFCPAVCANIHIPYFHFQWRYSRGDKVELPDRANEFAKSGMFEYTVDKEDCQEIAEDQPGCPPGGTPKIEQFISEEDQNKKGQ
jgi:hypothetical protein